MYVHTFICTMDSAKQHVVVLINMFAAEQRIFITIWHPHKSLIQCTQIYIQVKIYIFVCTRVNKKFMVALQFFLSFIFSFSIFLPDFY